VFPKPSHPWKEVKRRPKPGKARMVLKTPFKPAQSKIPMESPRNYSRFNPTLMKKGKKGVP